MVQYDHTASAITEISPFLMTDGKIVPKFKQSFVNCLEKETGQKFFSNVDVVRLSDYSGVISISGRSDAMLNPSAIESYFGSCFQRSAEGPLKEKLSILKQSQRALSREDKRLESTILGSISMIISLQQELAKCKRFSKLLDSGNIKAFSGQPSKVAVMGNRLWEIAKCSEYKKEGVSPDFLRTVARYTNEESRLVGLHKQHSRVSERLYSVQKEIDEIKGALESRSGLSGFDSALNIESRSLQKKVLVLIVSFLVFVLAALFIARKNGYA